MSIFVQFGTIVLAALIHALLQLNVGGLLLLYHSSLGKHVTRKTRTLASNFILGSALMILLGLLAAAFVILVFFGGNLSLATLSLLIGILFALAIIVFCVYYRRGNSTELWLPRVVTKYIGARARATNSRVEAFSLGMLTCLAEMPFSVCLLILSANVFLKFSPVFQAIAILIYLLLAILPLLICRIFVKKGKTVAQVQRWRVKNKTFLRVLCGCGFLVLGLFLIAFEIVGKI